MSTVRKMTWSLVLGLAVVFGSSGTWAQEPSLENVKGEDEGKVIIIKQDGKEVKRVQIKEGKDDDEKIIVVVNSENGQEEEIIINTDDLDSDWGDLGESIGESIGELIGSIGEWIGESGRQLGRSFEGFGNTHMARSESGNTRAYKETQSAYSRGTIKIDNIAGKVTLTAWDKNEIEVTGKLGEDVTRLDFKVDGDTADIEVVVPNGRKRKIRSELVVFAPRHSNVDIETISASVTVIGFDEDSHKVDTTSGAILLENVSGELDLESVSGSVTVKNADDEVKAGSVSGAVKIEGNNLSQVDAHNVSGSITIKGTSEEIDANTVSGSIRIETGNAEEVKLESVAGSIIYEGGMDKNGELRADSLSGSIRINFDEPVEGEYDLQTFSGSIRCSYGPDIKSRGKGKNIRFDVNDGDASIRVETFSGSIVIE